MKNIAIFASGSGTNADNIIRYFDGSDLARVTLLVSDNPRCGAVSKAATLGVNTLVIDRREISSAAVLNNLNEHKIDYIVLAGFLRLIHADVANKYEGRIVNIHPALLPKYGGKGMYGDRVHEAVIAAREKESGITIHLVDEQYDRGTILAQYSIEVTREDTPESLASKIHELEHRYFPRVIEMEIFKLGIDN